MRRFFIAATCATIAASIAETESQSSLSKAMFGPTGCFYHGAVFHGGRLLEHFDPIHHLSDPESCQEICEAQPNCTEFGFFPPSGACYLAAGPGRLVSADFGISGPKRCPPHPAACIEYPDRNFPGETAEQSDAAWPSGISPPNLQCWPRTRYNQPEPCKDEPVTVLDTIGDAGGCLGLMLVDIGENDSCEANCASNVLCPLWQEIVSDSPDPAAGARVDCWQGVGYDCWAPRGNVGLKGAGRFMHGHFRVIADIRDGQVLGLTEAFRSKDAEYVTVADAVKYCNHTCLSLISCQVWQYSSEFGCWIENPTVKSIVYPLTRSSIVSKTDFAGTVVAGQYIQRLCGKFDFQTAPKNSPLMIRGFDGDRRSEGISVVGKDGTTPPPPASLPEFAVRPGDAFVDPLALCTSHTICPMISGQACCPTTSGIFLSCCGENYTAPAMQVWSPRRECRAHGGCPRLKANCCPNAQGLWLPCCSAEAEEEIRLFSGTDEKYRVVAQTPPPSSGVIDPNNQNRASTPEPPTEVVGSTGVKEPASVETSLRAPSQSSVATPPGIPSASVAENNAPVPTVYKSTDVGASVPPAGRTIPATVVETTASSTFVSTSIPSTQNTMQTGAVGATVSGVAAGSAVAGAFATGATGAVADGALVPPATNPPTSSLNQGRFVTGGTDVFWQNGGSLTRHLVPPTLTCDECGCRENVLSLATSYVESLPLGIPFDCGMIAPTRPLMATTQPERKATSPDASLASAGNGERMVDVADDPSDNGFLMKSAIFLVVVVIAIVGVCAFFHAQSDPRSLLFGNFSQTSSQSDNEDEDWDDDMQYSADDDARKPLVR